VPNYLIIGGTSGIGLSVAEKLLAAGHQVFITGRDAQKAELVATNLNTPYAILDATQFADVEAIFELAKDKLGSLQGVVNCAGSLLLKSAHITSQADYEKVISANLTTAFATIRSAGKTLTKEGGSVVLVSSAAALSGIANHEAIAAAKAGVIGLALSAAATYASFNVRINVVAPGLVETPMTAALTKTELSRKASEAMHALGRLGKADEVASAILFFLNPDNSWITGQVLAVDGGLSTIRPKAKL
jgi:NAD(P)-dependent dehydrogenase (short-subunit alcohol dehydrogenase family)